MRREPKGHQQMLHPAEAKDYRILEKQRSAILHMQRTKLISGTKQRMRECGDAD
jgi:hypothetical protein